MEIELPGAGRPARARAAGPPPPRPLARARTRVRRDDRRRAPRTVTFLTDRPSYLNAPSKPTKPAILNTWKNGFLASLEHQFHAEVSRPSMHEPAS